MASRAAAGRSGEGQAGRRGMLPRERVLAALRFEESDICPYYIWVDAAMMAPLAQHYGVDNVKKTVICDHQVMREIVPLQQALSADTYIDDFGAVWRQAAELHVERPALAEASLKGYSFPDLTTDAHFSGVEDWLDANSDRFTIMQLGMLHFERSWAMRGMENILLDMYDAPLFVDQLFDGLESVCNGVIDRLLRDFGDKIDAIGFSEDMGGQTGMLLSPQSWRRFLKPHQKRMFDRIRAAGKVVYVHSCGNVEPIVGELIEMGVNMLQPIQPETMDIFDLKKRFGRNICFAGGISTQHTLPYGTPQQVRAETQRCIDVMAKGGGYVVAPAKPILPGVSIANAVALIDTIVNQSRRG
jgi:uroporphyrinogen decarboxylase